MAVTFATPVAVADSNVTSVAVAMTGVTSGQPIILVYFANVAPNLPSSVADTFSTPYTWTVIDANVGAGGALQMYIGTGGAGTSGTINLTGITTGTFPGAIAVACIGASTASGLSAVDVHGINTGLTSPSRAPTASGEGAVACVVSPGASISGSPSSPWVATVSGHGGLVTQASPTSGVGLTATWTSGSSSPASAVAVVKSGASAAPTSGFMGFF